MPMQGLAQLGDVAESLLDRSNAAFLVGVEYWQIANIRRSPQRPRSGDRVF